MLLGLLGGWGRTERECWAGDEGISGGTLIASALPRRRRRRKGGMKGAQRGGQG